MTSMDGINQPGCGCDGCGRAHWPDSDCGRGHVRCGNRLQSQAEKVPIHLADSSPVGLTAIATLDQEINVDNLAGFLREYDDCLSGRLLSIDPFQYFLEL